MPRLHRVRVRLTATPVALALVVLPASVLAQSPALPPVGFRSGLTQGPGPIPTGTLVLETGLLADRGAGVTTYHVGEVQLHVPLGSRVEVQLAPNSLAWRTDHGASTAWRADGSAGMLVQLADAAPNGWRPTVSVAVGSTLPTGSGPEHQGAWQPTAKLLAARPVGARGAVMANVGYTRGAVDATRTNQRFATLLGRRLWTERVGSYVEGYAASAAAPGAGPRVVAHGGLTYLIGTTHHVDAHVGVPVHGGRGAFAGLGIMQRL